MPLTRRRSLAVTAALAAVCGAGLTQPTAAHADAAADRAALSQWWAPVNFQDVDSTGETALGGKSDYITSYDYDGDLNGRNNWENTGQFPLAAHVYYSVVQTPSFSYLLYTYFHPRDWSDGVLDNYQENLTEHENDAEGVLVVVANDGSAHGQLKAAITVAHSNFYSWVPSGSDFTSGQESVDGTLKLQGDPHDDGHGRPFTTQQPNTHAAWAEGYLSQERSQYASGDGIVYYPGSTAEVPAGSDDRDVQYTLTDVFAANGMWANRTLTTLFATTDNFAGDDSANPYGAKCGAGGVLGPANGACDTDAANPPWAWDDGDDLPGRGYLATNPAELVWDYFDWPGKPAAPDLAYTWDQYNGITS
ncbi:hypothetical protein ACWDE0_25400 [Streptomyces sp. 900105755]